MSDHLYDINNYLSKHHLIFWYNGPISQTLIGELGAFIKNSLLKHSDRRIMAKVFSILIELMQNINKYSVEFASITSKGKDTKIRSGMVAIGIEDGYYLIASGNKIPTDSVEEISNRINVISDMDRNTQNQFYKSLRRKQSDEQKIGAGLGIIEIARKASKTIEYNFRKIDDVHSYFSINVFVKADCLKQ